MNSAQNKVNALQWSFFVQFRSTVNYCVIRKQRSRVCAKKTDVQHSTKNCLKGKLFQIIVKYYKVLQKDQDYYKDGYMETRTHWRLQMFLSQKVQAGFGYAISNLHTVGFVLGDVLCPQDIVSNMGAISHCTQGSGLCLSRLPPLINPRGLITLRWERGVNSGRVLLHLEILFLSTSLLFHVLGISVSV